MGIALSGMLLTMCVSCQQEYNDNFMNNNNFGGGGYSPGGSGSSSGNLIDFGLLSTFTVDINTASLTEKETVPTDENDPYYNEYIENNFEQKNLTSITFDGTNDAKVEGVVKGDTIDVEKGKVEVRAHSKGLVLKISGTTSEGSLKVYSDKKLCISLDNVSITNPEGAAINIQNGNCFVVITGANKLSDSSAATYAHPEDEDMKAVLFSEDDLRFSGTGILTVSAENKVGKACISCDDTVFIRPNTNIRLTAGASAGNGIKANDAIVIKGGVQNIEVAGAGTKGLSSDGVLTVEGGRTTIITTGGVDTSNASDPSGCAAIKCDSVLQVNAGELYLKSTGQGGKGISVDQIINIAGGDIFIITEGGQYGQSSVSMGGWKGGSSSSNSVSPKGIRCDGDINISGGNVYVRTAGSNGEGIESKTTLNISGGNTAALAYDDGFNAKQLNISGGKALAVSMGNCDGIDSNGNITATGGVLIGVSSTLGSEDGIDLENTLSLSNATVIGISAGGMGSGKISGHYVSTKVSGSAGDYVALCDGDAPLVTFQLPRTYSNGNLVLSAPGLSTGSYTLRTGVTPTGGTSWMNYLDGATSVSGGTSVSVTSR